MENLNVIKVGTNVLTKNGELDSETFESLGRQIRKLGEAVILVSSGAITAGMMADGIERTGEESAEELQRFASRGWDKVVQKWEDAIGKGAISATLITKGDMLHKNKSESLMGWAECCLAHGDVAVVNENDVIDDSEIRYGDNDKLAAHLACLCATRGLARNVRLMLLTNKDGLNKVADDDSTMMREVGIAEAKKYAGGANNPNSRGGMISKVEAAELAMAHGVETTVANGRGEDVIAGVMRGEVGTRFVK